jgi:hypothetical protein
MATCSNLVYIERFHYQNMIVFSKLKSLNISALEKDRKTMAFDKKG